MSLLVSGLIAPAAEAAPPLHGTTVHWERMGAGAPSGWYERGENYEWEWGGHEGPLGPGAARIRFTGKGDITLTAPAVALLSDLPYALRLWARAEPAQAEVSLRIFDNTSEKEVMSYPLTPATDWTRLAVQETLPKATRNHYCLELRIAGTGCVVEMDGLWFGLAEAQLDDTWNPSYSPAAVTLLPSAPWGLVTGAEPMKLKARVAGSVPEGSAITWSASNTSGVAWRLPDQPLTRDFYQEFEIAVDGDGAAAFGMHRIEARLIAADGKPLSLAAETLLARAPEPVPGPMPESYFGTHVLLQEPDIPVMAKLGYKWLRIHDASGITKWGYVEPEKGTWTWRDDQIELARKHGFSIMGMLDGAPAWASGTDETGYFRIYHAPKNIDEWRNYVKTIVEKYAGVIDEWEVWNEPWDMFRFFQGGSPGLYTDLLKSAYAEAKAVNPACTLIGLDTYPPFWEQAVLASGAYGHYDLASWHRYDPTLQGRPNDAIALVTARINAAQSQYGEPKPTLCSEGGTDVAMFHGSFFSFADRAMLGDWSLGADKYARWYLSIIASGNKRFLSYSTHGTSRHGANTHNLKEPGPLLRPLHLSLAALAHFVDGATLQARLAPAPDVTALVFRQERSRPFAHGSSTVVALYANGDAPERLPRPLPESVQTFDRWGNPIPRVAEATRSLTFLVTDEEKSKDLIDSLQPGESPVNYETMEALLTDTARILSPASPRTSISWSSILTPQGSFVMLPGKDGALFTTREELREHAVTPAMLDIEGDLAPKDIVVRQAGQFSLGTASFAIGGDSRIYRSVFGAVQDGPSGGFRLFSFSLIPVNGGPDPATSDAVLAVLKPWEQAMLVTHTRDLHGLFHDGPAMAAANTTNGEYFLFTEPEYLITMINTAVTWGPAQKSEMLAEEIEVLGDTAVVAGTWNLASLAFGSAPYAFSATLHRVNGAWKLASIVCGPEKA